MYLQPQTILTFIILFMFQYGVAVWPQPRELITGESVVWISPQLSLVSRTATASFELCHIRQDSQHILSPSQDVCSNPQSLLPGSSRLVCAGFRSFKHLLGSSLFVPIKFHPPHALFEAVFNRDSVVAHAIEVEIESPPSQRSPEAYHVNLYKDGHISINAGSEAGILHAFTSLAQLFFAHSQTGQAYTPYAPVKIDDWPRFEHRGLDLDIARNEITPDDVIRTLDAMSFNKFNRLHLHATDSQSWPLEIPSLPHLAARGAYRVEQIWTVAALRSVQAYGATRGIEVYVEIDMPGHTSSVYHSSPELVVAYDRPLADFSAWEPPSGQLALGNDPGVSNFVETVINDLLTRSSPYSKLFHLGGDELNTKVYELESSINSSSKETLRPFVQAFYDNALRHVQKFGVEPILWEESVLEWDLHLPRNSTVQVWRSSKALKAVIAKGYRTLFGAASHWYLDCGFGGFLDPTTSANSSINPPYLDWCTPYNNWKNIYSYNPLIDIPDDKLSLVIGGEVHLWSELTDSISLDNKLWPRASAAAEILWRGPSTVNESVTRRLADMRERLVKQGIHASVVQMDWCLMNAGSCVQ